MIRRASFGKHRPAVYRRDVERQARAEAEQLRRLTVALGQPRQRRRTVLSKPMPP